MRSMTVYSKQLASGVQLLSMCMPGDVLTLHMLGSHSHTVCYAPNDTMQHAAGFRCPALEVMSQLWACLVKSKVL